MARAQGKSENDMLAQEDQPQAKPEQVTYRPGPEDPNTVIWRKHKFQANVPKTVNDVDLIEQARGNKHFKVGDFDPQRDTYKDEPQGQPKTSEQYRAHVVAWLKKVESVDDLCERWANELKLRTALEVGYDDFHYLSSLIQPKLDDLLRREDEPRKKRDELIAKKELSDLELQIVGVGSV